MKGTGWKCDTCAAVAITDLASLGFAGITLPDGWLSVYDGETQSPSGLIVTGTNVSPVRHFCSRSCLATWVDAPSAISLDREPS